MDLIRVNTYYRKTTEQINSIERSKLSVFVVVKYYLNILNRESLVNAKNNFI